MTILRNVIWFHGICTLSLWACQLGVGTAFAVIPSDHRSAVRSTVGRSADVLVRRSPFCYDSRLRRSTPSSLGGVVIDRPAEKEGEEKKREWSSGEDGSDLDDEASSSSSSWSLAKNGGGFIPNIPLRLRRKAIATNDQRSNGETQQKPKKRSLLSRIPSVMQINDIHQYKAEVADVKDQMVVVRFYAPWCRACRAIESSYRRLPKEFPSVKFVEVPLTKGNAYLHEGLGVRSLPFAHIYEPDAGLVEERKINKHVFSDFKRVLRTYVNGECEVTYDESGSSNGAAVESQ